MRKTLLFLYLLSLGSIAAYGQTRLTQDPKLERQLHESGLIHQPLPLDIENSFETNGWKKEVLQSAPLTRSAGTEGWSHSGAGSMSFSTEKTVSGKGSIKLQFPTFTGKKGDRLSFRPRLCHLRKQQCYLSSRRRQSGEVQPHRILHLSRLRRRAHRQHEPHVSQCRYSCQERI